MTATPEDDRRELQRDLTEKLGVLAPKLGPPPQRVKAAALWAWLGALAFGGPAVLSTNADGVQQWGWNGMFATLVCAAVAFGYDRLYWGEVRKARAMIAVKEARRSEASGGASERPQEA